MSEKTNLTDVNQDNTQISKKTIGFGKAIHEIFETFATTIVIMGVSIKIINYGIKTGFLNLNLDYISLIMALILYGAFIYGLRKIVKKTEIIFGDNLLITLAVSLVVIIYAIYEYTDMRDSIKAEMVFEKLEKGYDCRFNPQQLNLQNNLTITLNDKKNEIKINNEGLDCKLKEKE